MKSKGTNKKVEVNDGMMEKESNEKLNTTPQMGADCLPFHRMYRKSKCHFREER
jgi:hypothetical protein